jgi:hypothetical protein
MRHLSYVACLSVCLLFLGCNNTRWNFVKGPERTPTSDKLPPVLDVVAYLNDNSSRLRTIRCAHLDLTCSVGTQSFGLRGKMVSQSPRSFLMSADSLGKTVVDLGSNDKEFWYWMSKGDPYQVFCSYKDLEEGKVENLPFPFQPDWIMEALGQGRYGPADKYTLEPERDTLKLVERTKSPQGIPVKKVIVMRGARVQPPNPQILGYLLVEEATGKEICSAKVSETQIDRATGGVFPRRMELRWPGQKMKLAMKLDGITVNAPVPPEAFVRQPLQGIGSFDLATRRIEGGPLQRVEGVRP